MKATLAGIAVALLVVAALGPSAKAEGTLVGEWKLDEGSGKTITDSSGLGNSGTLTGNVSWVPGIVGSALAFDGVSGYAHVPDNSALEPPLAVSVGVWVRHPGSPGQFRYILAKGGAGCVAASYGLYTGPGGGLEFYVSRGHGAVYARSPDAGTRVWDGNWHLAVGTFNGSTIRLYLDGVQVGSGTSYAGTLEYPLASSNELLIGNYLFCQNRNFTFLGDIDDVTIWDQALSAATVRLMAQGAADPATSGGSVSGSSVSGSSVAGKSVAGHSVAGSSGSSGGFSGLHPALKLLETTPARFAVAAAHRGRPGTGTDVSYVDSQVATSTFTVFRREAGVRKAGACSPLAPARRRTHSPTCFVYVAVGRFRRHDHAGVNRFHFEGRVGGKNLTPGAYLLTVAPSLRGRTGATASVAFQIVP